VVITLAHEGAVSFGFGRSDAFACEPVANPIDTTGAGDLLTGAYIWADLRGAEPADRVRWAVLYASLSVTTPTGIGGALTEASLLEVGMARGLDVPPLAGAARV